MVGGKAWAARRHHQKTILRVYSELRGPIRLHLGAVSATDCIMAGEPEVVPHGGFFPSWGEAKRREVLYEGWWLNTLKGFPLANRLAAFLF